MLLSYKASSAKWFSVCLWTKWLWIRILFFQISLIFTENEFQDKNLKSMLAGVFWKIGFLKYFAKFTGKHLCQSFFFNKVANLSLAEVFSGEFCEIPKNVFLTEQLWPTACRSTKNILFYSQFFFLEIAHKIKVIPSKSKISFTISFTRSWPRAQHWFKKQ